MKTGLAVGEVMTQRPISVPGNLAVRECAKIMAEKGIGSLLVVEDDRLLGIVTEEDLVAKVLAQGKNGEATAVSDIMTTAVITTTPAQDVYDAITLMRDHDIRHLPVLEEKKLAGFLTVKDILKVEPALFDNLLDSINLREEERKLSGRSPQYKEGFCEICGNFSEGLGRGPEQRMICDDCRD